MTASVRLTQASVLQSQPQSHTAQSQGNGHPPDAPISVKRSESVFAFLVGTDSTALEPTTGAVHGWGQFGLSTAEFREPFG